MKGKITPDKGNDGFEGYAGTPPLKADLMIFWFFKMLFQLCIFWLLYFLSINMVMERFDNNYIMVVIYTLLWLFISDIIASICAWIIKMVFLKKNDFIGTQKNRKYNANRLVWQYFLYCIFRSIGYVIGITGQLSFVFMSYVPFWFGFWAFLFAWIIVSVIAKTLAFFISAWITKSI